MNILVTGANGQLGNEMRVVARNSADNYIFTDVAELDITDAAAVEKMVTDNDVKVIVNCAAYTNVDKAEDDREFAELLNARAVENLAQAIRRNDGLLVHVSTDYVFGGTKNNTPCREDEPANPTGVYGVTKLHGEQAIIASGCHHIIIRTAWLYSEFGKNFLKTMLDLTTTKPQLKVVFDQVGSPTYAYDLALAIFDIVENRKYVDNDGIYHYSNEGVCSWFDFTKMIAEYAGHTGCDIQPCHSDEFPSKVVRPSYSVLDKTKIKKTFGVAVPYWTDSLRVCMTNLKTISK
ncbi:dTDP-4-dehydrorhamnose reductase [Barnesiella sp. An22]|uniref:dTDP-4-dehydrorhamnose reductase n=1 Tax=Barnesiella sp. An22 TaxID=1965590 RepID=UPI000B3A972D|nr:dTDP-4-dehydrorhamnose reductase [Barnesiella sp. An22]OUO96717.1 dTDP-4-dehydrorhamnose reductase [Barnesiella sp. An22]